jgi:dTDP-4-dehydrorhamnose 3,5-epimerase
MEGSVWDVVVDIRKGSPTFGKHVDLELNGENKKQLLVPRGFAHGFVVLSEFARFAYKVDNYYSPKHDRGIAYNDIILNIDWKVPQEKLILSQKDNRQPAFKDADYFDFKTDPYV